MAYIVLSDALFLHALRPNVNEQINKSVSRDSLGSFLSLPGSDSLEAPRSLSRQNG